MAKGKMTPEKFIKGNRISQAHIAAKMKMPVSTFKNKLNGKVKTQVFTDDENFKLIAIVHKMGNEALSCIN